MKFCGFLICCLTYATKSFDLHMNDKLRIDFEYFDAFLLDQMDADDTSFENAKVQALTHFIVSKEPDNCQMGNILKVVDLKELKVYSKSQNYIEYIKNPCLTFMATFENEQNLKSIMKDVRIPGQPYIFAMNKDGVLFEIQIFSQRIVQIKKGVSTMERRSDFNGAKVKLVDYEVDLYRTFLPIVRNQLNFTIEKVDYQGYGSIMDGKWNGAIKQLIDSEIDVGKYSDDESFSV